MPREIKESDWKLFKQLHQVALERFSQRILSKIGSINADSAKSSHQRYLDIFEIIGHRDREMTQLFDDLRRSTALVQIALIQSRGLLTEEEFSRFSTETRSFVEVMLEGRRWQITNRLEVLVIPPDLMDRLKKKGGLDKLKGSVQFSSSQYLTTRPVVRTPSTGRSGFIPTYTAARGAKR